MKLELKGVVPPMVTPFTAEGDLDEAALRAEVRYMLDQGVHGLVVGGSTGEGHVLSLEESVRITRIALEEVGGRVPVIAGVLRSSTREAIRYGLALKEAGADGLQITPVTYFHSPSLESVHAYYAELGRAVDLPLVVFNMASRRRITAELIDRLSGMPQLAALKQSGRDLAHLADLLLANGGRLRIVTAIDDLLYPAFVLGADGAIAPLSAVVPDLCVQLWDAFERGDHQEARSLHERILTVWRALNAVTFLPAARCAIELRGRQIGPPRHPLLPVSPAARAEVAAALESAGVSR